MSALELAETIDLDGVPTCPLCLLELARKIRDGERPSPGLVARTADWVWLESGKAVREAVVRARMQEVPFAEEALRELDEGGFRSGFARAVVGRLARELADELTHTADKVMYAHKVKRLQIMIEEDLDEALERQARKERTSKAALIRRYVAQELKPLPPLHDDPLWDFVGKSAGSPDDSVSVDDVVYAR